MGSKARQGNSVTTVSVVRVHPLAITSTTLHKMARLAGPIQQNPGSEADFIEGLTADLPGVGPLCPTLHNIQQPTQDMKEGKDASHLFNQLGGVDPAKQGNRRTADSHKLQQGIDEIGLHLLVNINTEGRCDGGEQRNHRPPDRF